MALLILIRICFSTLRGKGPADITNAGGVSLYGTMGQGGNAFEWQESAFSGANDLPLEDRGARGGSWVSSAQFLESSFRVSNDLAFEGGNVGFRVAALPEPSASAGVFGALALGFALWRRRGCR